MAKVKQKPDVKPADIENKGGRATSSVSGETDYVVVGHSAGSKLETAKALDVPMMDEDDFKEFLSTSRAD